jgi:hypothetical protein
VQAAVTSNINVPAVLFVFAIPDASAPRSVSWSAIPTVVDVLQRGR